MSIRSFCGWSVPRSFIAVCVLVFVHAATASGQDLAHSQKLVICGGGSMPDRVFDQFRKMSGSKPSLVVIPTASSRDPDFAAIQTLWRSRGFENVRVLHSRDRELVSSRDFLAPLETATAVWFGGGSQQRIADVYLDTLVEEQLYELLKRGGVIGGTSAGAAIQSRVMIASGSTKPNISTGFNLLRGAIIDQHFLRRNRIPRLLVAVKANPKLVGFGIDEGTALIVQDGKATVTGASYVLRIESKEGEIKMDAFGNSENVPIAAH